MEALLEGVMVASWCLAGIALGVVGVVWVVAAYGLVCDGVAVSELVFRGSQRRGPMSGVKRLASVLQGQVADIRVSLRNLREEELFELLAEVSAAGKPNVVGFLVREALGVQSRGWKARFVEWQERRGRCDRRGHELSESVV